MRRSSWLVSLLLVTVLLACDDRSVTDAPLEAVANVPVQVAGRCDGHMACKKSCDGGDVAACVVLGSAYADGDLHGPGRAEALLSGLCDHGQAQACWALGLQRKAASLYLGACELSDATACHRLGMIYWSGAGVKKDWHRASELIERAVISEQNACDKQRDARACAELSRWYFHGLGVPIDRARAAAAASRACDLRDGPSCFRGADALVGLSKPVGVPSIRDALPLLEKGCAYGHGRCCSVLARAHATGERKAHRSGSKAMKFARAACDFDDPSGCHRAAMLLIDAPPFARDRAELLARRDALLTQLCELGARSSCETLLADSDLTAAERTTAAAMAVGALEASCARDVLSACEAVAKAYASGSHGKADLIEAARFYKRSCELAEQTSPLRRAELCKMNLATAGAQFAARQKVEVARHPGQLVGFSAIDSSLFWAVDDAADDSGVTCADNGISGGSVTVYAANLLDGKVHTVVEGQCAPLAFSAHGQHLYWVSGGDTVVRCAHAACEPEAIATVEGLSNVIAADDSHVVTYAAGKLIAVPMDGERIELLEVAKPYSLAVDDTYAYYATRRVVYRTLLQADASPDRVAVAKRVVAMVAAGASVHLASEREVKVVDKATSSETSLMLVSGAIGIAVDRSHVYVARSRSSPSDAVGALFRKSLAVGAGDVESLLGLGHQPVGVSTHGSCVYWAWKAHSAVNACGVSKACAGP
jgi:TPR repeat protein